MELAENDAQLCQEKISQINPLFRITHAYTTGQYSDQLLALHALFAVLDEVVSGVSDHFVAQEKLQWWRSELQPGRVDKSRHPLIRYLQNTGAASLLPAAAVSDLFQSTLLRLEASAPANELELIETCETIYRPRIELEAALRPGSSLSTKQRADIAGIGGLQLLLLESFVIDPAGSETLWWLPLSLLARCGLNRHQLLGQLDSQQSKKLFEELFAEKGSVDTMGSQVASGNVQYAQSDHHLWLMARLHERYFKRLKSAQPDKYGEVLGRYYTSDVFSLWRLARKLRADTVG